MCWLVWSDMVGVNVHHSINEGGLVENNCTRFDKEDSIIIKMKIKIDNVDIIEPREDRTFHEEYVSVKSECRRG